GGVDQDGLPGPGHGRPHHPDVPADLRARGQHQSGLAMDHASGELRRRITYLMLFRVVMITLVLGVTVALHIASPEQLGSPAQLLLFALIVLTYSLSLGYAFWLPRLARP